VHHDPTVGEHESGIGVDAGLVGELLPSLGRLLGTGDARPCQQSQKRNCKCTESLHLVPLVFFIFIEREFGAVFSQ
jgi:hypothetical protein